MVACFKCGSSLLTTPTIRHSDCEMLVQGTSTDERQCLKCDEYRYLKKLSIVQ